MSERTGYYRTYDAKRRAERHARWQATRPQRDKINAQHERWCRVAGHDRPGRHVMCRACRRLADRECRALLLVPPKEVAAPVGICACGCGQPTKIAAQTKTAQGWRKGEPVRYVAGHNRKRWRQKQAPSITIPPLQTVERLRIAHDRVRHAVRLLQAHPGDIAYARALDARRAERDAILRLVKRGRVA